MPVLITMRITIMSKAAEKLIIFIFVLLFTYGFFLAVSNGWVKPEPIDPMGVWDE